MRWVLVLLLSTRLAFADGEKAGDFDYYVLSLSWSPTWCALEGDARGSPECAADADFGWVLHGLWPQYETGWPSYCFSPYGNPGRQTTDGMADIMGSGGLAWYQWKKHGRCAGLAAESYFDQARRAYEAITRPEVFHKLTRAVELPAAVVEEAFLTENPQLWPDAITVTCKDARIQEVRICLTPDLEPRDCGADTVRDCRLQHALFEPVR